jgi:hypothetical protein
MKRVAWLIIPLLLLAVLGEGALAQPRNLSAGRGLGIGLQAPCAISLRYWTTDRLGLEGNFLLLNEELCLAGKLLLRLGDTSNFDLYTVFGGWYLGSSYASVTLLFALAGMELSISPNFALNLEFGEGVGLDGQFDMLIGMGIHFYFLKGGG